MNNITNFIAFESPPPPTNVNQKTWKDRIIVLGEYYPNKWAKFGPFSSKKSTQTKIAHINTVQKKNRDRLEHFHITCRAAQDNGNYYLYIKVTTNAIPLTR
jgi:hypothetical protein